MLPLREVVRRLDKGLIVLIRDKDGFVPPLYSGEAWSLSYLRPDLLDRDVEKIGKEIWECQFHIAIKIGGKDEHGGSEEKSG